MREGVLVIPTDDHLPLTLFSFFSSSVLLPPAAEPLLVEDIWQVGTWGRETYNRPGRSVDRVVEAVASHLERTGFATSQIGLFGDATSSGYWDGLKARVPRSRFLADGGIIERMQRRRSSSVSSGQRFFMSATNEGRQVAAAIDETFATDP